MLQFAMRIMTRRTLREFWERHADAQEPLRAWMMDAERATWKSPEDIKRVYANASILPGNRVIFNIKGNAYRLIGHVNYPTGFVNIRFVGTHAEYDKINAETI
jgi:mRNA interferase HigB